MAAEDDEIPLEDVSPGEELAAFQACLKRAGRIQALASEEVGKVTVQAKRLLERWATRCSMSGDVEKLKTIVALQLQLAVMQTALGIAPELDR